MTRSPAVSIKNLTKRYGSFYAVNDISLDIYPGEIFSFLGVNGAGKTTTLRMAAGVLDATSGSATICGFDISSQAESAKKITGFIPDRPYLYNKLTAREYLNFCGDLYGLAPKFRNARIDLLLNHYSLTKWENELIESFSHGMKQRLATCSGLIHDPQVVIIDEPMVGLDPHGAKFLKQSLKEYASAGKTILLSTHSLHVAEEIADRIVIINGGKVLCVGTLAEIKAFADESGDGATSGKGKLEDLFLELTASSDMNSVG